jgi:hypoxanthine phosphoribosyltransferase
VTGCFLGERLNFACGVLACGDAGLAGTVVYEVPTWSQIYELLLYLSEKIRLAAYVADVVVGVARGGLVPGRVLADLLGVEELATLQIEYYTGVAQTKTEPTLKQAPTTSVQGKMVLLVDDIVDSGESLKLAKSTLKRSGAKEIKTATLYRKPQSTQTPDFTAKQTEKWVIFPWDTKETLRQIIQQKGKRQANQEIAKIVKAGLPKQLADRLLADMQ